jgi:RNA polymerase sigma factor (sigma-70 family)
MLSSSSLNNSETSSIFMSSGAQASSALKRLPSDEVLVRECLLGNQQAWSDLIDKYKNLIFSIPVKYGLPAEDAADIFQTVCFTALEELSHLREPKALAAWLIRLTARKCARWKREKQVYSGTQIDEESLTEKGDLPEKLVEEVEQEQILREAISEMTPECGKLIHLLFFAVPPVSYDEAAQTLGFAKGSIGATRMRCLEKLRRALEKKGFR